MSSEDLLTRVKENLRRLGGEDTTDSNIQSVVSSVRSSGQRVLLQQPRRGTHVEYQQLLHHGVKKQLIQEATAAGVHMEAPIHPAAEAIGRLVTVEQWREMEYLTVTPNSFEALKQLPELQQLIAYTAADVVRNVSGPNGGRQLAVCGSMVELVKHSPDYAVRTSNLHHLVESAEGTGMHQLYFQECQHTGLDLMLQCPPSLRQPAPPDTPEHGAALRLFTSHGLMAIKQELEEHKLLAEAANASSSSSQQVVVDAANASNSSSSKALAEAADGSNSSSGSRSKRRKLTRLQNLWAHAGSTPQQQQQRPQQQAQAQELSNPAAGASDGSSSRPAQPAAAAAAPELLPPPNRIRGWPLSPHIDLQLQVHPNLLLAQAVLVAALGTLEFVREYTDTAQDMQVQQQLQDTELLYNRVWRQLSQKLQPESIDDPCLTAVKSLQHVDFQTWLLTTLIQDARGKEPAAQSSSSGGDGGSTSSKEDAAGARSSPDKNSTAADASQTALSAAPTAAAVQGGLAAEAAAPGDAAAAIAGQAREQGNMQQRLYEATCQLATRCLVELVAWGDQQQVPLQALQLLTAVRQLEATAIKAAREAPPAAAAAAAAAAEEDLGAQSSAAAAQQQAAQRELVQQSLSLLQHVRALNEQGLAAAVHAADAEPPPHGIPPSSCGTSAPSSSSSSSSNCRPSSNTAMPPCQYFAADGPLSTCWGAQEPREVPGLWQVIAASSGTAGAAASSPGAEGAANGAAATAAASVGAAGSSQGRQQLLNGCNGPQANSSRKSSSSSSSSSGAPGTSLLAAQVCTMPEGEQQQQVHKVLEVLLGSAATVSAQQHVSRCLTAILGTQQAAHAFRRVSNFTLTTRKDSLSLSLHQAREIMRSGVLLRTNGFDVGADEGNQLLGRAWLMHEPFVSFVAHLRSAICTLTALPEYSPFAWQRMACIGTRMEFPDESAINSSGDSSSTSTGGGEECSSDDYETSFMSADAAGSCSSHSAGSSNTQQADYSWAHSGSNSNSSTIDRRHWQSPDAVSMTHRTAQVLAQAMGASDSQQNGANAVKIKQAASTLRQLASTAAAKMLPLQQWHLQHMQRQREAAVQANQWWGSKHRTATAVAAATGRAQRRDSSSDQSAPAAAAAGEEPTAATGTEPGSSTRVWSDGSLDYNMNCPLCLAELKQQQLPQQDPGSPEQSSSKGSGAGINGAVSSSSSSSNIYSSWPVPYDDPFLWRRLMWRLLGKVSPEAQAFYAKYLNMCPHCCNDDNWEWVTRSVERCLWSGPKLDVGNIVLTAQEVMKQGSRSRCLRQFSRVINQAYSQIHHASTVLVSKQVLLALSPLHHQVLPPPEVAHYLPSSFTPAVGKALMQQLFEVPVLDGFQHQHCSLQLWHVWWHVGLRRYQWLQQRQQQQCQRSMCKAGHIADSSSSSSSSNGVRGSNSSSSTCTDQLYMDADARLYAVGFATRLLAGKPSEHRRVTSSTSALVNSMAQNAVQKFLHTQAQEYVRAEHFRGRTLHVPGGFGQYLTDLDTAISRLFVIPTVLPAAEPVLTAVALGPRIPLVPLQQQQGLRKVSCGALNDGGKAPALLRSLAESSFARHYVRLGCPEETALHEYWLRRELEASGKQGQGQGEGDSQQQRQQQKQGNGDSQQQQQQHGDKQEEEEVNKLKASMYLTVKSDAEKLMLCDPVPAECLLGPEVWSAWHQELTALMCCDVCGIELEPQNYFTCIKCRGTAYCSHNCANEDEQHEHICDKLQDIRQRYKPAGTAATTTSSSSSGKAAAPLLSPQQQQQQVPKPAGVPDIPALPILSSLLKVPVDEPGPLNQHLNAEGQWPRTYGQLDDIVAEMGRWVARY